MPTIVPAEPCSPRALGGAGDDGAGDAEGEQGDRGADDPARPGGVVGAGKRGAEHEGAAEDGDRDQQHQQRPGAAALVLGGGGDGAAEEPGGDGEADPLACGLEEIHRPRRLAGDQTGFVVIAQMATT